MISRQWSAHSSDDHLIHRPIQAAACNGCGRRILVAIVAGWDTYVDSEPLTIQAEIEALLHGRFTYDLVTKSRSRYLLDRDVYRARAARQYPVLANHVCPSGREPSVRWQIPDKTDKKPVANPRPKPAPDNSPIPF